MFAMASDEDDDLYDEEFDFVDDDDEEEEEEEVSAVGPEYAEEAAEEQAGDAEEAARDEEPVDEYGRPEPAANYVVHLYEHKKFSRTIDRPFTPEDAEAFATEFNRTSKNYGRFAVSGKNDAKPKKTLD
jgi:hypothetical protein